MGSPESFEYNTSPDLPVVEAFKYMTPEQQDATVWREINNEENPGTNLEFKFNNDKNTLSGLITGSDGNQYRIDLFKKAGTLPPGSTGIELDGTETIVKPVYGGKLGKVDIDPDRAEKLYRKYADSAVDVDQEKGYVEGKKRDRDMEKTKDIIDNTLL